MKRTLVRTAHFVPNVRDLQNAEAGRGVFKRLDQ